MSEEVPVEGGAELPDYAVARLQNTRWRLTTSWWILPPLVSLGLLCWVGFAWAGFKTRLAKYWISAGAWFAVSSLIAILPAGRYTAIVAVACWFLPTMQSIVMMRRYLVERAVGDL
ncbi:hypothetical protein [Demequina soli]|uniref:hypothetical protein n=1 Tax=Demequina soli TaxID=1638987 RepID=UPI000AC1C88B|nr:hypothetical protein [Demequina soli]